MRPFRPLLARLVLALSLAWAGVALLRETGDALEGWRHRQRNALPCWWRLGMAPAERLRQCLAGADGLVPPDSVVVFTSPRGPCSAEFFRRRWAAYLLPDLQVAAPDDLEGRQLASFLISYRRLGEPPPGSRLELIRQLDGGRLYRIVRP